MSQQYGEEIRIVEITQRSYDSAYDFVEPLLWSEGSAA